MKELNNIKIGASPLTGEIYLYRHGVKKNVALDKRPAEPDVISATIDHMMHDAPRGAKKIVKANNGRLYLIKVTPVACCVGLEDGSCAWPYCLPEDK